MHKRNDRSPTYVFCLCHGIQVLLRARQKTSQMDSNQGVRQFNVMPRTIPNPLSVS